MTRQEAIELLRELWNFLATPPETDEAISMAIKALEQKPKRGKWILGKREWEDNYIFTCSECSHDIVTPKTQKIPYCWFCGARMESDEE